MSKISDNEAPGASARETWREWIPPGWFGPTDEDLITRDELLRRMAANGVEIHPNTLKIMERQGLVPRPVRQWHEGATRALYPPWAVDVALRAYARRRGRWALDDARADVRDYAKSAIFVSNMEAWGGDGIPIEFIAQLVALAKRQEAITGRAVPRAEVRFFNEEGNRVSTLSYNLADAEELLDVDNGQ